MPHFVTFDNFTVTPNHDKVDQLVADQQKSGEDSFLMDGDNFDSHDFLDYTCPTCVDPFPTNSEVRTQVYSNSPDNNWKLEAVQGYLDNERGQMSGGSAWWKNISADISSDLMTAHIDFI